MLKLYSYGETISIVFWNDNWKPESFFDKIVRNRKMNLHTLCLLGWAALPRRFSGNGCGGDTVVVVVVVVVW